MSLPHIPNITPEIKVTRVEAINLILASIAMEEISLSHILNAEGEKIQEVIKKHTSVKDLIKIDKSVERTLRNTIKSQILLQFKLEDTLDLDCCEDECEPEE